MPTVGLSPRALADLECLVEFLREEDPAAAAGTGALVTGALRVLASHPLLGRPVTGPLRELVISRGRTGYIALYAFNEERDLVWIHRTRHQREAGFED